MWRSRVSLRSGACVCLRRVELRAARVDGLLCLRRRRTIRAAFDVLVGQLVRVMHVVMMVALVHLVVQLVHVLQVMIIVSVMQLNQLLVAELRLRCRHSGGFVEPMQMVLLLVLVPQLHVYETLVRGRINQGAESPGAISGVRLLLLLLLHERISLLLSRRRLRLRRPQRQLARRHLRTHQVRITVARHIAPVDMVMFKQTVEHTLLLLTHGRRTSCRLLLLLLWLLVVVACRRRRQR